MTITPQGIKQIDIRFFIMGWREDVAPNGLGEEETLEDFQPGTWEVSEREFIDAKGTVLYTRSTVFDNGCRQVTLTRDQLEGMV